MAALCAALDLVIGFANATTQLAGAVGAPLWLLAPPAAWTCLGTDRYPWRPQARVFHAPGFDWDQAMAAVAAARGMFPRGGGPAARRSGGPARMGVELRSKPASDHPPHGSLRAPTPPRGEILTA